MSCDWVREQIPECLAGTLDKSARAVVIEHIETCANCRKELGELGVVWRGLEGQNPPEADPRMRVRFQEMMDVYQEAFRAGQQAARQTAGAPDRRKPWFTSPAWRAAGAFALLVAGVVCGRFLDRRVFDGSSQPGAEMAEMRAQLEGLRQLVALSLLDESSASSRLRGVHYSIQMTQPDAQVLQSLLRAVSRDPNVDVRLETVDALEKYANEPDVRHALVDAIAVQESPLVQVALIDLLGKIHAHDALPALRKLAEDSQADETVRQHAELALNKIDSRKE